MNKIWMAAFVATTAACAAAFVPISCTDLGDIPQNYCGNNVVEQPNHEDCDGFGVGLDGGVSDGGFACSASCRVICGDGGTCPWGWGCGTDGICRRPAGAFTRVAGSITSETVEHLLVADIDGDGRKDSIVDTGAELRVHYYDDQGLLTQTSSFTGLQTSPTVGDFDGDGRADLGYKLDISVSVIPGNADRQLSTQPFPISLPPDLQIPQGERLIVVRTQGISADNFKLREVLRMTDSEITTFTPNTSGNTGMPQVIAQVGTAQLPSPDAEVPVARFNAFAPCDQIAFPNVVTNQIEIYSTCRGVGASSVWNDHTNSQSETVSLPMGFKIDGPVFATTVDKDLSVDLVIYGSDDTGAKRLFVAYGDGLGQFNSSPVLGPTRDHMASPYLCLDDMDLSNAPDAGDGGNPDDADGGAHCPTRKPFAVADLDSDGVLDVVSPCGVLLTAPDLKGGSDACGPKRQFVPVYDPRGRLSGTEWSTARVLDLNGDGIPDVAGASCESPSIAYLLGSPIGIFNPYTIPTLGAVDELVLGDFDGDHITDLAYTERSVSSGSCDKNSGPTSDETLSAVFGSSSGGPSAPVNFAKLEKIQQVIAGNLTSPINSFDLITDMGVISVDPKMPGQLLFDVFQGSSDRRILAPFYLVAPDTQQANSPWLLTMGHFTGASDPTSIAILASEAGGGGGIARLWLATQSGSSLTPNLPLTIDAVGDPRAYVKAGTGLGAWISSINLGGASDQLLAVRRDLEGKTGQLITLGAEMDSKSKLWMWSTPSTILDLQGDFGGPIVVSNLDAYQGDDVVLTAPDKGVRVLWNGADGKLSTDGSTVIGLDQLASVCKSAPKSVVGAASVRAAIGQPRALVILADKHAYLATLDAASPTDHKFSFTCLDDSIPPPDSFTDGQIASGDIDGDGVDDVVIAAAGEVTVFKGVPVNQ